MEKDSVSAPVGMNIVSKAALLLEALYERGELSPAQLTDLLDEPMSSVYRLIANLESLGWVERGTRRGIVRLGLAFVKIGRSLESQLDIRRIALPQLEELTAATGETAVLVIRRGWYVVCVERSEGNSVLSQTFRLGDSHPLHKSAASRAVLAFEPDGLLDEFLEFAAASGDTALSDVVPTLLRRQVAEVLTNGTSISDSDVNPGMAAIAAPVFNHRNQVVGAVSISGLREGVLRDADDLIRRTHAAAQEIGQSLGYSADASTHRFVTQEA